MSLKIDTFNDQSGREEIANSVSHGIGALLGIAGACLIIIKACFTGTIIDIVSASIYGFSIIELYTMSSVYHGLTNIRAKRVLQILDHCSVFILILGSYTPLCLSLLGGKIGWTLFFINTFFTILGITLNAISIERWHKASLVCYLAMGWSILFAIKPLMELITWNGFLLLLFGGVAYSIGVLFYKASSKYMHAVWHLFVLIGTVLHFLFMYFYIY